MPSQGEPVPSVRVRSRWRWGCGFGAVEMSALLFFRLRCDFGAVVFLAPLWIRRRCDFGLSLRALSATYKPGEASIIGQSLVPSIG